MKPVLETVYTDNLEVVCDGGNGVLGHPRVFLHIDQKEGAITCPYCSRHYMLKGVKKLAG